MLLCLVLWACLIHVASAQEALPLTDIPDPMPLADEGNDDFIHFLLLGSDTTNPANAGRTDVLLIVSVNRTAGTVGMLSLPRDLWVYVPGWEMRKINVVFAHGENSGAGGHGAQVIADTIRYNLGLSIDYFARVDFNDFREIIDSVGGVELTVDCAIQDWRLREPDLDPAQEANWAMYTLPVGVHTLDGDLALWYVRSRNTSSDFDRGRRQQAVMRGLWRRIVNLGLVEQIADLWPQVLETVQTDVPLDAMIDLAPLALALDSTRVASYTFRLNEEVTAGVSPDGASVLVPVRDAVARRVQQLLMPPTSNQIVRDQATVEIINASGNRGLDRVAADRLALEGFTPRITVETLGYREYTVIYDYTGDVKGTNLAALQAVLHVRDDGVIVEPLANREVDYRVVLGGRYNACTYGVLPPDPTLDGAEAEAGAATD